MLIALKWCVLQPKIITQTPIKIKISILNAVLDWPINHQFEFIEIYDIKATFGPAVHNLYKIVHDCTTEQTYLRSYFWHTLRVTPIDTSLKHNLSYTLIWDFEQLYFYGLSPNLSPEQTFTYKATFDTPLGHSHRHIPKTKIVIYPNLRFLINFSFMV